MDCAQIVLQIVQQFVPMCAKCFVQIHVKTQVKMVATDVLENAKIAAITTAKIHVQAFAKAIVHLLAAKNVVLDVLQHVKIHVKAVAKDVLQHVKIHVKAVAKDVRGNAKIAAIMVAPIVVEMAAAKLAAIHAPAIARVRVFILAVTLVALLAVKLVTLLVVIDAGNLVITNVKMTVIQVVFIVAGKVVIARALICALVCVAATAFIVVRILVSKDAKETAKMIAWVVAEALAA